MGPIFLKTPSHCPYLSLFLVVCVAAWARARSENSSGGAGQPAKIPIKLGYITGCENTLENFYDRPGRLISGALTYAVEQINNDTSILPNHTLEWIIAETYGVETESIKQTALLLRKGISVYIGPQETCVHEGRIAAAFNLPMISYYCTETAVSDKTLYPTFARTKPTDSQISKSVVSLLRMYNWRKVTFIHPYFGNANNTADDIFSTLEKYGFTVQFRRKYTQHYMHIRQINPFVKIVEETYLETRVYIMLGLHYEFVGLMENLQDRGLLDTGEYFVIGVCLEPYDWESPDNFLSGVFQMNVSEKSALAFRHFVGLIHTPQVDPMFHDIVDHYLEKFPFNYTNYLGRTRKIKPEAAYLYDAVWLYARAADRLLKEGGNLLDGHQIIANIVNQTYYILRRHRETRITLHTNDNRLKTITVTLQEHSYTCMLHRLPSHPYPFYPFCTTIIFSQPGAFGYMSRINLKGDTEGNFSLLVQKYVDKKWGLYPVGNFKLKFDSDEIPTFEFYKNESIHWIAGNPPLDEPSCGFRHERCIPVKSYTREVAIGIVGGIFLTGTIIGYLIFRNWQYEQDLASLLWKIDYKDITFGEQLIQCYTVRTKPTTVCRSPSQLSLSSQTEFDFHQLFTHVGSFRGTLVAIRRVNKKHVELTRNVRKELKTMRELRHDNINPFIGACIDSPGILILTSYCSKGSLQDILENDDLQLDSMFIASLVHDIVRGMIYIHDSEIKSHGKLKSSNCVVDSRWVLKITDFGLHEFLQGAHEDIGEYAFYRNLLWRAPELLRKTGPARGTQEGDVFSFAIIMFEIYGRKGPYGDITLSPKEIIERVKTIEEDAPFRPRLSELGTSPKIVTDVIKESWDEDPHRRPDFKTIRSKLKPIRTGMKSNIFDNMLAMMEKYADNLEALVEERTDQLIEEKKKTEELLHEMLPRTVADQLMRGKRVEADTFDSVTIYFSDICGFTAMSSESTPMQVVDLLNDLYTLFDSTIEYYDVYKVETIGDAYMVVSGLPKTNGIQHAGEIASLSLHLLDSIRKFKIRHRPDDTLKLRIGIHSGACVAGVVGLKMPRYCLFGDTVNTASRMESTCECLKIHCSLECRKLLEQIEGYILQERGLTCLKGKGEVLTYWLLGETRERRTQQLHPVSNDPRVSTSAGSFRRNRMAQQALDRSLDWSPSSARNEKQSQSQSLGQGHNNQLHGQGQLNGDAAKPSSYLQPYPLLAGPRSQELLRRSSSRRRRLKFTLGIEDEELKEDVETMKVPDVAPNILIETTPLICRKHDVAGEVNPSYSPRCTSRV